VNGTETESKEESIRPIDSLFQRGEEGASRVERRTANSIVNLHRQGAAYDDMALPVLFGHTCSNPGMDFEGSNKSLESIEALSQNNEGFNERGKTRDQYLP